MIKKIAFTGISNLINSQYTSSSSIENEDKIPFTFARKNSDKISMQLNNNGSRDLDEMQPVLDKFRDSRHLNFLRLEKLNLGEDDVYIVNGKILEVNRENLGIFSKIQKLLGKIQKNITSPDIKKDYAENQDFDEDIKLSVNSKNNYIKRPKTSPLDILNKLPEYLQDEILEELPESYTRNEFNSVLNEKSIIDEDISSKKDCLELSLTKKTASKIEKSIQKTMERYFE